MHFSRKVPGGNAQARERLEAIAAARCNTLEVNIRKLDQLKLQIKEAKLGTR